METPAFSFYNVAIDSADKAIEAARKKSGVSAETLMSVVRPLSSAEIAHINLKSGEAKPA
jgi:hypothetical protein